MHSGTAIHSDPIDSAAEQTLTINKTKRMDCEQSFHGLVPATLPLAAAEVIRAVRIILPVPFDLRAASAVSVPLGGARSDSISAVCGLACLPILDGVLPPCLRVGYYFRESFLHSGEKLT